DGGLQHASIRPADRLHGSTAEPFDRWCGGWRSSGPSADDPSAGLRAARLGEGRRLAGVDSDACSTSTGVRTSYAARHTASPGILVPVGILTYAPLCALRAVRFGGSRCACRTQDSA